MLTGGLVARSLRGPVSAEDLVVSDGRIGGDRRGGGSTVDVSGCLIVPGHACGHHHLYSSLARGMPGPPLPPRSFTEILERVWWRLDRALDPETISLATLLGTVEAARCGTTSLADHHASPEVIDSSLDIVADSIGRCGLRAALCYEVTDRHGSSRARDGIAENLRFVAGNRRSLVRGMMGAHASFTIGPSTLEALTAGARDTGIPIHIHVAEDVVDERDSVTTYGMRTAHRLSNTGALGEGDLVAHGVCLDDGELATLRDSGAWLAHNPRSNMNNAVGYAPALQAGARVMLGTDGIDGDMFAETRACYLKARDAGVEVDAGTAADRLAAGAAFMGSLFGEPALGTLEARAPADLVVLEYHPPTPLRASNLAGHYLFGLGASSVRDVMVAGRFVVRDRRHVLVDEAELAARCREAAPRLWDRMEEL